MKRKCHLLLGTAVAVAIGALALPAQCQLFNSGSDGSLGALVVSNGSTITLDLPTNGIFNFTTITVQAGGILRFNRNALNTAAYLLATGDVTVGGEIQANGGNATALLGGASGPGGFDGGYPGGPGFGPGGGHEGTASTEPAGGSYGSPGSLAGSTSTNGSPLVIPLMGGSGGGGAGGNAGVSGGGGGGGGALLIASSTRIALSGAIRCNAGTGRAGGSGGAIRLVAPVVSGTGLIQAAGSGGGRARVDLIDRSEFALGVDMSGFSGGGSFSIGKFMTVFPPGSTRRLDIIQAADTVIPEGTNSPVTILLPFGSDTNRTVTVQARNFGGVVPIEIVLIPQLGSSVKIQTNIDNTTLNPATVTVPVAFPINTPTAVQAWTR